MSELYFSPERRSQIDEYRQRCFAVEAGLEDRVNNINTEFRKIFGGEQGMIGPDVTVRVPGRAEVTGNHVDYNKGKTISAAVDASFLVAVRKRDKSRSADPRGIIRVCSTMDENKVVYEIDPNNMERISENDDENSHKAWLNYVMGVIDMMKAYSEDYESISDFDILMDSSIPPGSGFSSSAAMEVAIAQAMAEANGTPITDPIKLIKIAQKAETGQYVRARTGYLDQASVVYGSAVIMDHNGDPISPIKDVEILDLDFTERGFSLVVINDLELKHNLSDNEGGYNARVLERDSALGHLNTILRQKKIIGPDEEIHSMRELSHFYLNDKQTYNNVMDELHIRAPKLYKRVKHIITETHRSDRAYESLKSGSIDEFQSIMNESGDSAILDYEVGEGVPELWWTVVNAREIGKELGYDIGIRNFGGGFNNATIMLVPMEIEEELKTRLSQRYTEESRNGSIRGSSREANLTFFNFKITPGAGVIAA